MRQIGGPPFAVSEPDTSSQLSLPFCTLFDLFPLDFALGLFDADLELSPDTLLITFDAFGDWLLHS